MSVVALNRRKKRRASAGTRLIWVMLTAVALVFGFIAATPAFADDDDDAADYSLYKLSSSVSSFYSNAVSPDSDQEDAAKALKGDGKGNAGAWRGTAEDGGSAGAFLGYPDSDKGLSLKWLSSQMSGSSATYSFDSFKQLAKGDKIPVRGLQQYTNYGAALQSLGLDHTKSDISFNGIARIGGGLMLLLYVLSGGVDMAFYFVLTLLDLLNPFKLFFAGVNAVSPTLAQGMTGGSGGITSGPLGGLASFLGGIYSAAQGIGLYVMIPVLFFAVAMSFLLFRRRDGFGSRVGRRAFQVGFIVLGVPLLGSMYSGTLSSMKEATAGANGGASQVVLSTYTDFENWMLKSRLGVTGAQDASCPMVIEWDQKNGKPSSAAQNAIRTTAICANSLTGQYAHASSASLSVVSDSTGASNSNSVSLLSGSVNPSAQVGDPSDKSDYLAVTRLLGRYMAGDTIHASDFEASVKGAISDAVSNGTLGSDPEDGAETASKWFTEFDKPEDLEKKKAQDINWGEGSGNPIIRTQNGLTVADKNANVMTFRSPTARKDCGGGVVGSDGKPLNCTLSPLSAYNYLNSAFSSNSVTAYSSEKAASGMTRESHASVSQIGSGLMKLVYWGNSASLLFAYVLFGFGYAGALLINSFRRSFQMALAIPGSGIGFMGAISRVIIYTVALVVEIIGTIFLYNVVQMVLFSLPQIVESGFSAFITKHQNLAVLAGIATSGFMPLLTCVFMIMLVIWLSIMALKFRKTIVDGIEEFVRRTVDRLLVTNTPSPTGGPSLAGAAGAGIGAGAGAVMRGRGMGMGANAGAGAGNGAGAAATRATGLGAKATQKPNAAKAGLLGLGAAAAGPAALMGKKLGLPGGTDGDDEQDPKNGLGPNGLPQLPGGGSGGAGGAGGLGGDAEATGEDDPSSVVLDENGNPMLDENGNPMLDENGNPMLDENGNPMLDENGNPITSDSLAPVDSDADSGLSQSGQFVDSDGNVVDSEGNPVVDADVRKDDEGNPIGADGKPLASSDYLDADGNPVAAKDVSVDPATGAPVDANGDELMSSAYRDADGELIPAKDVSVDPATGDPVDARSGEPLTSAAFTDADGNPVPASAVGLAADGSAVNTETGEALMPRGGTETAEAEDVPGEKGPRGLDVASGYGASMREQADQIRANGGLIDTSKVGSAQTNSIITVGSDSKPSGIAGVASTGRSLAADAMSGTGKAGAAMKAGSTVAAGMNSSAEKSAAGLATALGAGAVVSAAAAKRSFQGSGTAGSAPRNGSAPAGSSAQGSVRGPQQADRVTDRRAPSRQSTPSTPAQAPTRQVSGDRTASKPAAGRTANRQAQSPARQSPARQSPARQSPARQAPSRSVGANNEVRRAKTETARVQQQAAAERKASEVARKRAEQDRMRAKRDAERAKSTARRDAEQAKRRMIRAEQEAKHTRRTKN